MVVAGALRQREHNQKNRCGNHSEVAWCVLSILAGRVAMLIGYARVSKADGSQLLDLQRDALIEAGVDSERIYENKASGRKDHRPGLDACMKALQPGNSLVIWNHVSPGRAIP